MGKNKRKFIDKRYDNIYSFKVVQRSQKDPLVADENAPQGVLIDASESKEHQKEELLKYGVYFDDDYDYLQHLRGVKEGIDWENCDLEVYTVRKEDPKRKKRSKKDVGLVLPSSAFESYVEEPIGLLNKAASFADLGSDIDSDIAAALNSDEEAEIFDPDDDEAIPDNFISLLNAEDAIEEEDENCSREGFDESEDGRADETAVYNEINSWLSNNTDYYDEDPSNIQGDYDNMPALEESSEDEFFDAESGEHAHDDDDNDLEADEERDEVNSLPSTYLNEKNIPVYHTEMNDSYSQRTELQKFFDAKFDQMYERDYGEDECDLDPELIGGCLNVDDPVFQQSVEATKKQLAKLKLETMEGDDKDRTVLWVKNNMISRNYMQNEKEKLVDIEIESKPKFDLASFHEARARRQPLIRPKLLDDLLPSRKLTKKAIKEHNRATREADEESSSDSESEDGLVTIKSQISFYSERPKGETPEERKERKCQLKLLRKQRRVEKKANKLLYAKGEKTEKQKSLATCRVIKLGI